MEFSFYKYQGTGNDFILFDDREASLELTTDQVAQLCDRRFGIGADGLMLLRKREGFDFEMIYFNSDGNTSSMCGNGGRCIVAFAKYLGIIQNGAKFLAIDGEHKAKVVDGWVSLEMINVDKVEKVDKDYFLFTGSPHHVVLSEDVQLEKVAEKGKAIRNSERYVKEGTNVNFLQIEEDAIFVRTYERGVEDETFSCGTGVTAAAIVAGIVSPSKIGQTKVKTLGGELEVTYSYEQDGYTNVWLKGPAQMVFKGTVTL